MNNYCNNCGKSGHLFHQCKLPITSIGIIAFRIRPSNLTKLTPKILNTDINVLPIIEYLLIRRKETLGYIDFLRGKYSLQNKEYLLNMFIQMTINEKNNLKNETFDNLWKNVWGDDIVYQYKNQYKNEKIYSKEKFSQLISGTYGVSLLDLITESNNTPLNISIHTADESSNFHWYNEWTEPEWGFPKGRRNNEEKDYDCAIREFCEETGYNKKDLNNIQNVVPFEEIFTGSNYKSYKHKYFLMFMNYHDTIHTDKFQKSEVSKMEWKTYHECMLYIRPYNLEKKRLITNVEKVLRKMYLCQFVRAWCIS